MGVILVGALGAVLFGWQLVFAAFDEGIFWGFSFIASVLAQFAPLIGGDLGLVLFIPTIFSAYFILTRWDAARNSVVNQLFGVDIVLAGFLMIRAVS